MFGGVRGGASFWGPLRQPAMEWRDPIEREPRAACTPSCDALSILLLDIAWTTFFVYGIIDGAERGFHIVGLALSVFTILSGFVSRIMGLRHWACPVCTISLTVFVVMLMVSLLAYTGGGMAIAVGLLCSVGATGSAARSWHDFSARVSRVQDEHSSDVESGRQLLSTDSM